MKKQTMILLSVIMLFCVSCKKDTDIPSPTTSNTWKVGDYTFTRTNSVQTAMFTNYGVLATSSNKTSDNAFVGSILNISFVNKGEGEYNISDQRSQLGDGWDMHITCSMQTGLTTMTNYSVELPTSVKATVKKDKNGKYHITVSQPVKLVKDKDLNTPSDQSPETFMLTINDVY